MRGMEEVQQSLPSKLPLKTSDTIKDVMLSSENQLVVVKAIIMRFIGAKRQSQSNL